MQQRLFGTSFGAQPLDADGARTRYTPRAWPQLHGSGYGATHTKKNYLKPWRRVMWCIGLLTKEYRQRMYNVLRLYAKPLRATEPVICIDEKSLQLVEHSRAPLPMDRGKPAKVDYEYVRKGTSNLFVAVEPKAGRRVVSVTERRCKVDFVGFVQELLTNNYANARRIHLVLDNLNTHFRKSFEDVLGKTAADKLLRRVDFHYTPKHASWLNMAEVEISVLSRQCLDRRMGSREFLRDEVDAWQQARNAQRRTIEWKFTRQDADEKLGRHYVS
ncbi:IS630 family transposase [Verminephrobacter aporrectodeae]|uniref:IS630 family transposase n=1 Tax=Verminephrobacter aporrectodeae TaxID=1110389 RepID=UPI0022441690|nr:IS630 family transposase [Verminephrobacter aporrectodeae]